MKKPIEYLGNVTAFTTREELYKIGRQIQEDAINKALELCLKSNSKFSFNNNLEMVIREDSMINNINELKQNL